LSATLAQPLSAQWTLQSSGTAAEFRGLHAVSDRIVWAAGRGGVVAHTADGGASWAADTIPGAAGLFFIAIHASDSRHAWVLGTAFAGSPTARIYRTTDAGRLWTLQYQNTSPGVFFDGMAFWSPRSGIAFGDPLDGKFPIIVTRDGGISWQAREPDHSPLSAPGEAAFAASGTAITLRGIREVWFATGGGPHARVLHSADGGLTWDAVETPARGGAAKGIFGIAFGKNGRGVAVGGDYQKRAASEENLLRSDDSGRSWRLAASPGLVGVQYGVAYAGSASFLAAGPDGSAFTLDGGTTWTRLDGPGFNTLSCAAAWCWAAGTDGRIGRLRVPR
jgi:photosystem II stability/assembly factor-like uncharacterized protein